MKTAGEILRNTRVEKKLEFEEIEKATKIRTKYLDALEKNDFAKIPGGAPTTKGFIKNYAEYLGLSAVGVLAVFRRDFRESKTGQIIPQGYYEPINSHKLSWNPRFTVFLGVAILVAGLSAYLFFQVFSYFSPPSLSVSSPKEGSLISQQDVEILGKSDPDATVYVNGELVAIDEKGNFQTKISLFPGDNKVKIESVSRRGKKTEINLSVARQTPINSE